jgi:regulator of protease activity HflC (stomatin/prohibitin superfamily)
MRLLLVLGLLFAVTGCSVINQGEVGVLRRWGKLDDQAVQPGLIFYEPVSTQLLRVPVRLTTVTVDFTLPSKEGLNVDAQISILYRVEAEKASQVLGTIGENYEEELVVAVFRSAAADVSARFFARDLYSAERGHIEKEIKKLMTEVLAGRGFVIEAVLMKAIALPPGLAKAIESKLSAEQDAERMQFLIQREKLEADRKRIEAEGLRDSQKIVAEGLTEPVLRLRAIEAFRQLATSPNAKVIVTDGKSPLQVAGDGR